MKIQKIFTRFVAVWTCSLVNVHGEQIGDIILLSNKEEADKLKIDDFLTTDIEDFEFPDLDFGVL
jgi:hypothetical protein